jgi:hypothetical protein
LDGGGLAGRAPAGAHAEEPAFPVRVGDHHGDLGQERPEAGQFRGVTGPRAGALPYGS